MGTRPRGADAGALAAATEGKGGEKARGAGKRTEAARATGVVCCGRAADRRAHREYSWREP